jgi:hypothetical protein
LAGNIGKHKTTKLADLAIIFDRNSQVCLHKVMLANEKSKATVHGVMVRRQLAAIAIALCASVCSSHCQPTQAKLPRVVFTKRQFSSDFVYRGTNVIVRGDSSELFVQKNRGPGTVEMLLDYELAGDFIAKMEVEFATAEELGITLRGGTPVPYYGFRSADGLKECYFPLGTVHAKGKRYQIVIRRDDGKVSATCDNDPAQGNHESQPDPGYVCLVMNDVSCVRLHQFHLESPPGNLLIDYGQTNTNDNKAIHQ